MSSLPYLNPLSFYFFFLFEFFFSHLSLFPLFSSCFLTRSQHIFSLAYMNRSDKRPTVRGIKRNLSKFTTTILHLGRRRDSNSTARRYQKNNAQPSPPPPSSPSPPASSTPSPSPQPPPPQSRRFTARVLGLHNKIWRRKKKHQQQKQQEADDEDDDNDNDDQQAVCGCGRPLEAGWECPHCRFTCPTCQRALGEGEQCSRCQSSSDSPLPSSTIAS
ncbi:hypothetical protein BDB00DRAFT_438489 [Zychaea mexicana]|uniref:uncharacterized protein n=1 Tax=Zychaea mexicana TaxID=64656 RepID=UPI0022FDCF09|nr:uncharacterized protein BDB00DRAFT_438489 [Zychaea mexicana]KAI9492407.1 hypothetical protein BDB00DRAFT_438489 [Zychaea mexicana]